jgi:hypothetical protein
MKFAFKIKMEPVMQAAIIVAVIAFSSGSLATIATTPKIQPSAPSVQLPLPLLFI